MKPRNTGILVLGAFVGWSLLPAALAADDHGGGGLAVATLAAADPSTAAILTGIAEGFAVDRSVGERFVTHGELVRAVDAGGDRGCRTDLCLTRAAQSLGAALLLSGEVVREDDRYRIRIRLLGSEATVERVASRECAPCNEGALPAMLEEALQEVLETLGAPEPELRDDGRTIILHPRLSGGEFDYEDLGRTLFNQPQIIDDVEVSSLTMPDERLACVDSGETLRFSTTLQARNLAALPRQFSGSVRIELLGEGDDELLASVQRPIEFQLVAAASEEGGFSPEGDWMAPASVGKASLELLYRPETTVPLRVRTSWDDERLEELTTRPVTRLVDVSDFHLERGDERISTVPWGEEIEAHLVLTKLDTGAPAEVTVRVERQIRFWFDTEKVHAIYEIPAEQSGTFHLILPFLPPDAQHGSSEGYVFEVWVNGCRLYRSGQYK